MSAVKAIITGRQEWAKVAKVGYTVDGKTGSAAFWKTDTFAGLLVDGAEVELTFERKPRKDKPDEMEVWIASVNGQSAAAPKSGGGGRAFQPKSKEEIHASCIAGLLKTCREMSPAPKEDKVLEDARAWCELYWEQVGKVNG